MSRLADYFVVVGYDHEKEREFHYYSNKFSRTIKTITLQVVE